MNTNLRVLEYRQIYNEIRISGTESFNVNFDKVAMFEFGMWH
jgi:hypothetical protein